MSASLVMSIRIFSVLLTILLQWLKLCLAHTEHSINICCKNKKSIFFNPITTFITIVNLLLVQLNFTMLSICMYQILENDLNH